MCLKKIIFVSVYFLISVATAGWEVIDNQEKSYPTGFFTSGTSLFTTTLPLCKNCGGGVLRESKDGGKNWSTLFTAKEGTSIHRGVVSSKGNIFIVANQDNEKALIYASYDKGKTFREVDSIRSAWMPDAMRHIQLTPEGYVAAGCICQARKWEFRISKDEGKTWESVSNFNGETVVSTPTYGPSFAVNSKGEAFSIDAFGGIYRLSQLSQSGVWTVADDSIAAWNVTRLTGILIGQNDFIYTYGTCEWDCATTGARDARYLHISRDQGVTWKTVDVRTMFSKHIKQSYDDLSIAALSESQNGMIYAAVVASVGKKYSAFICTSADHGDSWSCNDRTYSDFYPHSLTVQNNEVLMFGVGLTKPNEDLDMRSAKVLVLR